MNRVAGEDVDTAVLNTRDGHARPSTLRTRQCEGHLDGMYKGGLQQVNESNRGHPLREVAHKHPLASI